jgi:hypothetical protein
MSLTVDVEIELTDTAVKRRTQALIDCGATKVYPMTLTEQMEMDTFLEEALATGRIRQSKSPLGAPFFFIKKKDG